MCIRDRHLLVIPLALIALISLHVWRVRKDGGLAVQAEGAEERLDMASLEE